VVPALHQAAPRVRPRRDQGDRAAAHGRRPNGHGPDDQDARRGANFGGPELDGGRGPVLAGGTH
jgi:hypothetical protein